jgi:hypothetical protein
LHNSVTLTISELQPLCRDTQLRFPVKESHLNALKGVSAAVGLKSQCMHRGKMKVKGRTISATTPTAIPSRLIVCNELTTDFKWCWCMVVDPHLLRLVTNSNVGQAPSR